MFEAVWFLIFGVFIFGTGLGIGWNMRGSTKEGERYNYEHIKSELERLRFILHEINEKVDE